MTAPKLTAEEAFRRAAISDPEDAAIALSELASLGFTLIPTDPASVEAMVERVRFAVIDVDEFKHKTLGEFRAVARAVLTAAIPELKK